MLEKLFKLSAHKTNVRTEIIAGITTFAAMSYILAVNPGILGDAGMDRGAMITVTAVAGAIGTLIMAALTNYPIALAPGMGLNAYFAYTIVLGAGVAPTDALALVFWNGLFFLLLSVTGVRAKIAESIPPNLRVGVQCGIGLFIAFIGLKNAGLIVDNPATFVQIGDLSKASAVATILGLILAAFLIIKKVPGAIIIAILSITAVGVLLPGEASFAAMPDGILSAPAGIGDTFFKLNLLYPLQNFGEIYPLILSLLFVDLFDTIGTLIGVSRRADLLDENGNLPKIGNALTADASATVMGALLGTSTTTSYVESATGVEAGGRTGLTGITVAACFLLALFATPIILIIPPQATAPALIMVGVFMMQGFKHIDMDDVALLAPAFVTMLAMPLTFSISEGIGLGFITHVGIQMSLGRFKEVSVVTYIMAILFSLHYLEVWG
ncbi:MAG: NCS2 family permease [Opitutales bacterium]